MKIVVLDDDPTGVQTVHGCLAVTRWDEETLRVAFDDPAGFFFVLTNARALARDQAAGRTYEIAKRIGDMANARGEYVQFISRGDSTLRGHFPVELDAIDSACRHAGLGTAQLRLLVPAFVEGGRITRGGVHYIVEDGNFTPVGETEFARDQVFGYGASDLRCYIEEKTGGGVSATEVRSVTLDALRAAAGAGSISAVVKELARAVPGQSKSIASRSANPLYVVSDAESYDDLDSLSSIVEQLVGLGVRVLVQSAASFVKAITHCPATSLVTPGYYGLRGIVMVGSHVQKTSKQLEHLLSQQRVSGIEIDVRQVLTSAVSDSNLVTNVVDDVRGAWEAGRTPVVYTTREELTFATHEERLAAGRQISTFLVTVLRGLEREPQYVIAKGGITSHDLLVEGTGVSYVRVLGQIHPGVPLVRIPDEYAIAGMPFVIFPGNVGDNRALTKVWKRLSSQ